MCFALGNVEQIENGFAIQPRYAIASPELSGLTIGEKRAALIPTTALPEDLRASREVIMNDRGAPLIVDADM